MTTATLAPGRFARGTRMDLTRHLTGAETRVALTLAAYALDGPTVDVTTRQLAAELGQSPSTVAEKVRDLIAMGAIEVVNPNRRSDEKRVLHLLWISPDRAGKMVLTRADRPRGSRGWSARQARGRSARIEEEDLEEKDLVIDVGAQDETQPTPAGRAVIAEIFAGLKAHGAPRPVEPPSELAQRRKAHNHAERVRAAHAAAAAAHADNAAARQRAAELAELTAERPALAAVRPVAARTGPPAGPATPDTWQDERAG